MAASGDRDRRNCQEIWCRRRGSNPHSRRRERDFESRASASSATPAHSGCRFQGSKVSSVHGSSLHAHHRTVGTLASGHFGTSAPWTLNVRALNLEPLLFAKYFRRGFRYSIAAVALLSSGASASITPVLGGCRFDAQNASRFDVRGRRRRGHGCSSSTPRCRCEGQAPASAHPARRQRQARSQRHLAGHEHRQLGPRDPCGAARAGDAARPDRAGAGQGSARLRRGRRRARRPGRRRRRRDSVHARGPQEERGEPGRTG